MGGSHGYFLETKRIIIPRMALPEPKGGIGAFIGRMDTIINPVFWLRSSKRPTLPGAFRPCDDCL